MPSSAEPASAPQFPPLLTGHALLAGAYPLDAAANGARDGSLGAGDTLWSLDEDRAAAAFVLEPDVTLDKAIQMVPVLMNAVADALGAIAPPNVAITFRWPDTILANGGIIGMIGLKLPEGARPDGVPEWLAIGFDLALRRPVHDNAPGHEPSRTVLHEEGCGDLTSTDIVEAVARHFLSWIDGWQHGGFAHAHEMWIGRANETGKTMTVNTGGATLSGTMLGLDEDGGLLLKTPDGARTVSLLETFGIAP